MTTKFTRPAKRSIVRPAHYFVCRLDVLNTGYHWVETKKFSFDSTQPVPHAQGEKFLTARAPGTSAPDFRPIQPLTDHPNLFFEFSQLTPADQAGMVRFANSFGLLGGKARIVRPGTKSDVEADSSFTWETEIREMQRAVELWNWLTNPILENQAALEKVIFWQGTDTVCYLHKSRDPMTEKVTGRSFQRFDRKTSPYIFRRFQPGDVVAPGWQRLQHLVTQHLREEVSPCLFWTDGDRNTPDRPLGLYVMPRTLLSMLWLQFALAIDEMEYRKCAYCGKPFIVGRGAYRHHKRYCTDSCRVLQCLKNKEENPLASPTT